MEHGISHFLVTSANPNPLTLGKSIFQQISIATEIPLDELPTTPHVKFYSKKLSVFEWLP